MISMIFGCGCASFSKARTSLRLRPSRLTTSLTNSMISGRCRSKPPAAASSGWAPVGAQASAASRKLRHLFKATCSTTTPRAYAVNTEAGEERHDRAASIAHQGQRHPDHRQQSGDHARVDEHVHEEGERETAGQQAREGILGLGGEIDGAADDERVQQEQQQQAEEAELLADDGEDEVGGALGEEFELRLAAVHPPLAEHAARADRDL